MPAIMITSSLVEKLRLRIQRLMHASPAPGPLPRCCELRHIRGAPRRGGYRAGGLQRCRPKTPKLEPWRVAASTDGTPAQQRRRARHEQRGRNLLKGQDSVHGAECDRRPWHSPDDAAGLILRQRLGAAAAHLLQAAGSVRPHAGQNHANSLGAQLVGHGAEQQVDAGPMPVDGWTILQPAAIVSPIALDQQVPIARCDIGPPRLDQDAIGSFLDAQRRAGIHTGSEMLAEGAGDVLGDDDAWAIGRQAREYLANGFGTAGRGADRDDLVRRLRSATCRGRRPRAPGSLYRSTG